MVIRKNNIFHFLIILLFLSDFIGSAQDSKSILKDELINVRKQSYFLIHQDSLSPQFLTSILQNNTPIALKLDDGQVINESFKKQILKYYKNIIFICDSLIHKSPIGKNEIIQIKTNEIESFNLSSTEFANENITGTLNFSSIHINNCKIINDSLLFDLWERTGKMPNFILAEQECFEKVDSIISKLNAVRKVFGVLSSEDGLLQGVSFKNFDTPNKSGYFSFPILKNSQLPNLIPYKAGYTFSPDIIKLTNKNLNELKEFKGVKLDIDDGLSDYFTFKNIAVNSVRANSDEIISNKVKITNDDFLGKVGFFDEKAFIDAGQDSGASLNGNFTIQTWMKPTKINYDNSILGKGNNFVLKLHQGFLTFTMAGVKDYISKSSPIPINKWTHISLVHSKENNALFFYVNGKLTNKMELIADYAGSEYNLQIGNNLWEEYFVGFLSEIKIWERELNSEEILLQYNSYLDKNFPIKKYSSWVAILVLIILLLNLNNIKRRFAKKRKKNKLNKLQIPNQNSVKVEESIEQISCFGGLKIINNNGIDVATKLSPKLKSLFLLIFLHSNETDKGINSKKLTDIIWPGKNKVGAKNIRGTSMQNLKALLSSCSEIELIFKERKWQINLSDQCYCDYHLVNRCFKEFNESNYSKELLVSSLPKVLQNLQKGRFLLNSDFSWLDPFIEKISNKIIEESFKFIENLSLEHHSDMIYNITEVINIYDDLNEQSLQLKLKVLKQQGKLSLCHSVFKNFTNLYKDIYKEDYEKSFEEFILKN